MVIGVGVDMVEVSRIQRALEDPKIGQRFRDRVYTDKEIQYCEKRLRKYESYAGRFAAKEAVMKALGTGWNSQIGWQDIETVSTPGGQPEIYLHNGASALAQELGVRQLSLSITHTRDYAMAYLIAQGE